MRALALLGALVAFGGCATPLARMDPLGASDKDVQYRNGIPIVLSRGPRFDVFVSPVGGATGRHSVDTMVTMVIGIRNRSGQRIDVSESNLSASAAGRAATVMSAADVEGSLGPTVDVAERVTAVAAAIQEFETTPLFGPPERSRSTAAAIQTAALFQRNSIDPGSAYVAAVGIKRDDRQASDAGCRISVFLLLGDEVHTFDFNEVPQHRLALADKRP